MIQQIIKITAVFSLIAMSSIANAHHYDYYTGPRFGIGVSSTDFGSIDTDSGIKFEGGYDFNRIVGMTLSYEQSDYDSRDEALDFETFKLGADLGYAFQLTHSISMKPYVSVGFHHSTEDYYWCSKKHCYQSSNSDTNTYYGIGLRLVAGPLYFDVSNEVLNYDIGHKNYNPEQVALTVGLKL
ncbi:porin family protein [Photobacterium minamisatsumaniensis]|uniref:porin family protein n=1 Tax=Photobacterium minamisatsumaniensis TaxID=2910233 RepID=UPI003D0E81BA